MEIEGLKQISEALSDYFVPLAAASGLTVALLEAVKKVFSIRGRFHKSAMIRWLAESAAQTPEAQKSGFDRALGVLHGTNHYYSTNSTLTTQTLASDGGRGLSSTYEWRRAYDDLKHLTTGQFAGAESTVSPAAGPANTVGNTAVEGIGPHVNPTLRFRNLDRAVFELETSRMMAQVQDAADAVLNAPREYPNLFMFFTRGCNKHDVHTWVDFVAPAQRIDHEVDPNAMRQIYAKQAADAYARLRLLVRRQLDGFQSVTTNRWDDLNQLWAVICGALILFVAQLISSPCCGEFPLAHPWDAMMCGMKHYWGKDATLGLVLSSLLGGVLAPLAKDILSSLSQLKFSK